MPTHPTKADAAERIAIAFFRRQGWTQNDLDNYGRDPDDLWLARRIRALVKRELHKQAKVWAMAQQHADNVKRVKRSRT